VGQASIEDLRQAMIRAWITGNSDRAAATFNQSLIGSMEAIDHGSRRSSLAHDSHEER